jgi:hypothetical protein
VPDIRINNVTRITAIADVPGEYGRNVTAFDISQILRFSAEHATRRRRESEIENKHLEIKTQYIAPEVFS